MTGQVFTHGSADAKQVRAAKAGHRVRFYGANLHVESNVVVTVEDTDGTNLCGPYDVTVTEGAEIRIEPPGGNYIDTAVGKGLQILLGGAVGVHGVTYTEYVYQDGAEAGERASQVGP
jgi:hypothetical protein